MENVRGLLFAKNKPLLDAALQTVPSRYAMLGPLVINAADFGAATQRNRVFVVGYDREYVDPIELSDLVSLKVAPTTVKDAIEDLSHLIEDGQQDGFDVWKHSDVADLSPYAKRLRGGASRTTGHKRIAHDPKVADRFDKILPGATDRVGRYPRLSWDGQAPTLRAGTGPDHGSYQAVRPIHPSEPRVITVREAARLQGFPDWFRFHPTAWHSFRMIGNSVSPPLSEALFRLLASRMGDREAMAAE